MSFSRWGTIQIYVPFFTFTGRSRLLSAECIQDTVVALQALAEYAAMTAGNNANQNLAITVSADTLTHSFAITGVNALVLQSVQVAYFKARFSLPELTARVDG